MEPPRPLQPGAPDTGHDPAAKLHFLLSPAAHGADADAAELIETHMSWVVLCGERALKMKKPVRYAFLDFSTPAAREHDAREELRLNRRLAPQVYLGLLALQWHEGEFSLLPAEQLPAPGDTVDWLVLMQRLPAHDMLDSMIARQAVRPWHIDLLAQRLAGFYRHAARADVCSEEYVARIEREQQANRAVLLDPRFRTGAAQEALDRFAQALTGHTGLLHQRVRQERIVDGHGDLRPEHVCLLQPPVLIDCLEFDPALREVDPFDELAFLGMECQVAGAGWIGPRLWAACAEQLDDRPPAALRQLYWARRALVRARLSVAHLLDPQPRTPGRWLPRGAQYLAQAMGALQRLQAA
ncbi:MAG: hypothetical protein AB1430_02275 [Pseudomonadota bacterium]